MWMSLVRRYRREFPALRWKVRRKKNMQGSFALTWWDTDCFRTDIASDYPDEVLAFILAHEVAHCLSHHEKGDEHHGDAFWAAYRRTYEIYEEWAHG
ncbi:MAG: SprT-like domain-containing protein [Bacteroidota bacterium]|jgi:predicted metal-dependent hydrolase